MDHPTPLPGGPSNLKAMTAEDHAASHSIPNRPAPKFRRTCPECGALFETPTHDRLFCTDAHRAAFHNRSSKVGRSVVPLAMAWREGRNVKGNSPEAKARRASAARAFDELCRALDVASREDRDAGRMAKLEYMRRRRRAEGAAYPQESAAFHEKAEKAAAAAAKRAAREAAAS